MDWRSAETDLVVLYAGGRYTVRWMTEARKVAIEGPLVMFSGQHSNRSDAAFDVVAIAASAGGLDAFRRVLARLPAGFPAAILVVQHQASHNPDYLPELLARWTKLPVQLAWDGQSLRPGTVFVGPADRHLLVRPDGTLSVRWSDRVRSYRPSADMLFESVATCLGDRAVAVVLTGRMDDGSRGVQAIRQGGGFVIAQDAATSEHFDMPYAAIETRKVDLVLPLWHIGFALTTLVMGIEAGLAMG